MEVRPPIQIDKGAGVAALLRGAEVDQAIYVGDDVTDLDAFRALAALAAEGSLQHVVRVGVHSQDGPPEIEADADIVVDGTAGVLELLQALATD
jgi:trehalose 6-phosphate phosphatase